MNANFFKQQIVVGSAPQCDIVISAPEIAPQHLTIAVQNGQLWVTDLGSPTGTFIGPARIVPNTPTPITIGHPLHAGSMPVPLSHPQIGMLLLSQGNAPPQPGRLSIGRDPNRVNLVVSHPAVSGVHATIDFPTRSIIDHDSKSGTYIGGQRIGANQPTNLDASGIIQLGPVTLSVHALYPLAGMAAPVTPPPQMAPYPPAAGVAPATELAPIGAPATAFAGHDGPARVKARTMIGKAEFGGETAIISVGRTPNNQIVVNHPQVSSNHAAIVREANGRMYLFDRGSQNGTFVRGQRLPPNQRVEVQNGERIMIGPMPLVIQVTGAQVQAVVEVDSDRWAGKPTCSIEAWNLCLEVPDRDRPGQMKILLDNVSFKALPGDLIALMGPSGAGKTTLLMTLNGYQVPTEGYVRINGEDLYEIYDLLRGSIGYVPQDDIVHPELTVWEAIRYSAQFRLPPDMSDDEIDQRVSQTIRDLGLEQVQNLQIGKPEKKVLSGGQRKRVNIALELVTDPVIMFLDEPTSGLAADDTTALINLLHDLAEKTGKTIIVTIHQPAKDEYEKFNLALIMGYGGVPIYFGPTRDDSYAFFGRWLEMNGKPNKIDNPRDMFDMLKQREEKIFADQKAHDPKSPRPLARSAAAKQWHSEFYPPGNHATFVKMYSGIRAIGQVETQKRGAFHRASPLFFRQMWLLISRYYKIKIRDRVGSIIMLAQAPIIGLLLCGVFGPQKAGPAPWCLAALESLKLKAKSLEDDGGSTGVDPMKMLEGKEVRDAANTMFFMVVSAIWFGTSNAAREIVSERAIYLRERMVNLRLTNYMLSKYILLSLVCVIQCTLMLGIVSPLLGFHGLTDGHPDVFFEQLGVLVLTCMDAVAIGLLLSALVSSSEAAMALTPIALIPQIILGGTIVPATVNPYLQYPMYVVPARWGFEGMISPERWLNMSDSHWIFDLPKGKGELGNLAQYFLTDAGKTLRFNCAQASIEANSPDFAGAWAFGEWGQTWLPFAVLGGMTVITLIILFIAMRRKDPV